MVEDMLIIKNFKKIYSVISNYKLIALISSSLISLWLVFYILSYNVSRLRGIDEPFVLLAIYGLLGLLASFFLYIADKLKIVASVNAGSSVSDDLAERIRSLEKFTVAADERLTGLIDSTNQSVAEYMSTMEPWLKEIADVYFTEEAFQQLETRVNQKHGSNIDTNIKVDKIKSAYDESLLGLKIQLDSQRTNSNINLFIGLVFATIGIIVLGYVFYTSYAVPSNSQNEIQVTTFLMGFIPRITFVVLIETVAFFFLSLYREDRNMIRFFRNEITNYESKFIGLETAIRLEDKPSITKAVTTFLNTERNFMMKKGDRLVTEALRESDDRLFDALIGKLSNSFDLSKIKR